MTTVRLRKADLEILAAIDSRMTGAGDPKAELSSKQLKAWSSFYERVITSGTTVKAPKTTGLSVSEAVAAFRGVLGLRLVLPAGDASKGWWAVMQRRISDSGLTKELCIETAQVAGILWTGPIRAESLIRQADLLLARRSTPEQRAHADGTDDMVDL